MAFALLVAFITLVGGIFAVIMILAQMWFNIVDLLLAYIPMGYLAAKFVGLKHSDINSHTAVE